MTSQGFARESRAGVFTLVCLSLSVLLHTVAAGSMPSAPAILAGAGLVLVVAFALAGPERRFPVIAAVLLGAQFGLHYLFEALPHAGHHGEAAFSSVPLPPGMVLAHLVAGLVTALWLRGGEAAAWRLLRWMARGVAPLRGLWFFLLRTLIVPATRPALLVSAARRVVRPAPGWRHSVIRRGPPASSPA
ncbi:hypothetical protein [Cryptosporangium japonicum]|uniref:MFS transporter n=1 Tax=Cryptosporangium japonicum TaxID=80872 RepID=A0ABN0UP66_9ACTN